MEIPESRITTGKRATLNISTERSFIVCVLNFVGYFFVFLIEKKIHCV